jgi:predicted DCC family thiol-disulfide oxidoreductase YuxK
MRCIISPVVYQMIDELERQKIILFDGVCNLCNGSVVFILQREKEPVFQFASIQSEAGKVLLQWCCLPEDYSQAVVLIKHGRIYLGSTAALKIGQTLKFPWALLCSAGFLLPTFIRDWVYKQLPNIAIDGSGNETFACSLLKI